MSRKQGRNIFKTNRVGMKTGSTGYDFGVKLRRTERTRDHVFPRAKGGLLTIDDLVISCQPCNQAKGDLADFRALHFACVRFYGEQLGEQLGKLLDDKELIHAPETHLIQLIKGHLVDLYQGCILSGLESRIAADDHRPNPTGLCRIASADAVAEHKLRSRIVESAKFAPHRRLRLDGNGLKTGILDTERRRIA